MQESPATRTSSCAICGRKLIPSNGIPVGTIRGPLLDCIQGAAGHPVSQNEYLCREDLNRFRSLYIAQVLKEEIGELGELEKEVIESIEKHELLSPDTFQEGPALTFGQRMADRIAEFGGSWRFISLFFLVLVTWMTVNSVQLFRKPFDPYPFILLNLVLSCVAALQAPVIMMSQNRQEARDRQRAENDYKINLKAELEIRHLHEKLDHVMTHQWQRMVEIQEVQIELMEEIAARRRERERE